MFNHIYKYFFMGIFFLTLFSCQSTVDSNIETYTVQRGDFISSVVETGELAAIKSQMILAPRISYRFGQLKIARLVEDGKLVKKGEILIEFSKGEVQKGIIDTKAEMEIAQAELRKAQANQASKIEELEANLEKTKIQHRISQLNLEKASYESEISRKEIELALERAKITLEKAEQEIENQKMINKQELNKLALKVRQAQSKYDDAEEMMQKLTVTASTPGIAIIEKSLFSRNKYQVDDTPFPGWPIIGLPDLSRMKALVQINEVDIAKIDTTLEAQIKMDAYPDTIFYGKVTEVAALAHNKDSDSKVKVFDVTILLDETDEKLMPGMTVSCEITVEKIPDTLFVPLDALFDRNGDKIVYIKNGRGFEPAIIKIGSENDDYVIISSGLSVGDQVAISDPFESLTQSQKTDSKSSGEKQ